MYDRLNESNRKILDEVLKFYNLTLDEIEFVEPEAGTCCVPILLMKKKGTDSPIMSTGIALESLM